MLHQVGVSFDVDYLNLCICYISCLYFTETGFYYSIFFHHWEGVQNIKNMIYSQYVNLDILQISHWYLPHVYEFGIFSHISSQLENTSTGT